MVRRGVRNLTTGAGAIRQSTAPMQLQSTGDLLGLSDGGQQPSDGGSTSVDPTEVHDDDPWRDARPGLTRRVQTAPSAVHHRLSYDFGSGVIALPDDGHWLEADEDEDSEEDYGGGAGLDAISRASSSGGGGPPLNATTEGADMSSSIASISESRDPPSSPSRPRYGTYYHHPERRRQTVPGAFPRQPS